jgi:hypothetical protein
VETKISNECQKNVRGKHILGSVMSAPGLPVLVAAVRSVADSHSLASWFSAVVASQGPWVVACLIGGEERFSSGRFEPLTKEINQQK